MIPNASAHIRHGEDHATPWCHQVTCGKEDLHVSASSHPGCASKGTHELIVIFGRAAPTYFLEKYAQTWTTNTTRNIMIHPSETTPSVLEQSNQWRWIEISATSIAWNRSSVGLARKIWVHHSCRTVVTLTVLLQYYDKTHNASKVKDIQKDASVGTLSLKNIGLSKEKLHGYQGWHRMRQQRHLPHGGW